LDERYSDGFPAMNWNRAMGNVTHATTGAPEIRRQLRQWHTMLFVGVPLVR
jgi:hypothetical protein